MANPKSRYRPEKAYENEDFLKSRDARALRIQSEYMEPESRFEHFGVKDTIVFFGSARIQSRRSAQSALKAARQAGRGIKKAEKDLLMSRYYEASRSLANRLTNWSKDLNGGDTRRFVVCTGGGPGIMEAANRGASEAKGLNIGLNISLPHEQHENPYITHHLGFEFHYFFMRKFWFVYMAKAIIVFPGGFGTLDELFEVLNLDQTGKLSKPIKIVLYGSDYWRDVINFDALVDYGTVSAEDLDLMKMTDTVDEAYDYITDYLLEQAIDEPGGIL
ncbi:MAG: TIGR00730 family Rossman fold protein [Rhodospirillales bacterium]|nr:TIGR00730 family Rossman fold protein [Rhodospirillales bacterium]